MFGRKTTTPTLALARTKPEAAEEPLQEDFGAEFEPLWKPQSAQERKSVESLLLERGQVNEEQLLQAQQVATQTPGKSITQILVTMSVASEAQVLSALAETLGLSFETPAKEQIEQAAFDVLAPEYIRKQLVLPMHSRARRWSSASPIRTTSSFWTRSAAKPSAS